MLLEALRADGVLSFAPGTPEVPLQPLNVIIGPNGSGKSNLIELIELLRAAPTGLAGVVREGGGVREWMWKGATTLTLDPRPATIEVRLGSFKGSLRYQLGFLDAGPYLRIVDEVLETADAHRKGVDSERFYELKDGIATIYGRDETDEETARALKPSSIARDESILSQLRDPEAYLELAWCGDMLSQIAIFREWSFGRDALVRRPQPADLPMESLLPDATNLGLLLNHLAHVGGDSALRELLRKVLPRFNRISTLVQGGTVQFFLHEDGLAAPIPAQRLSDGTLRVLAIAATLIAPRPPPLVCIEEPELGLHPDAVTHIAKLLVDASTRSQIIVTTHSDALVSALTDHVESVLTCEYVGGTRLQRLESGRLQHWLDNYRLGDLWRMGELGANP